MFHTIPFNGVCMNAAGCRSNTFKELIQLDQSASAATVTTSCTLEPKIAHPSPIYYSCNDGSIHSNGMSNMDIQKYIDYALIRDSTKPFIISLAGKRKEIEYLLVYNHGKVIDKAYFEINLAYPNMTSFEGFAKDLKTILMTCRYHEYRIGIKMPVIFDVEQIEQLSHILNSFSSYIHYISCSNSLSHGLILKRTSGKLETAIAGDRMGLGAIGGKLLKPFSLMNVREFSERITIPVIGCGGITSKEDVEEYLHCGASWCQIGTHLIDCGTSIFSDLNN